VPSSVFDNITLGNAVTIKVTNSDGLSSNTVDKTSIAAPSGGTITTSGDFRIHTFTSSSNFVNTISNLTTEYLVIAGGGGGGSVSGGGGGAGGLLQATVSLTAQSYSIVIGGGGSSNSNGGDTTGLGVTADGGGVGGAHLQNGADGGSGGGGGGDQTTSGGSATPGQGNNGGTGFDPGPSESAGGGGGAGAVGGDGTSTVAGSGGAGLEYSTFATATSTGDSGFYAGGGGGGVGRNPGQWIETSYNTRGGVHKTGGTPLRKNFAGVGYTYDEDRDAFIPPKPFNSWTLNEDTCLWDPPVAKPELTQEQIDNNNYYRLERRKSNMGFSIIWLV
jgi:hypothetical protein